MNRQWRVNLEKQTFWPVNGCVEIPLCTWSTSREERDGVFFLHVCVCGDCIPKFELPSCFRLNFPGFFLILFLYFLCVLVCAWVGVLHYNPEVFHPPVFLVLFIVWAQTNCEQQLQLRKPKKKKKNHNVVKLMCEQSVKIIHRNADVYWQKKNKKKNFKSLCNKPKYKIGS